MELVVDNKPDDAGNVLEFRTGMNRKCKSNCLHQRFVIDETHGSVECADCGETVSAFHALVRVARKDSLFRRHMVAQRQKLEEMKAYKPWLRAVKALEKIWRGKMLPMCPHCKRGITAEALEATGCIHPDYEDRT